MVLAPQRQRLSLRDFILFLFPALCGHDLMYYESIALSELPSPLLKRIKLVKGQILSREKEECPYALMVLGCCTRFLLPSKFIFSYYDLSHRFLAVLFPPMCPLRRASLILLPRALEQVSPIGKLICSSSKSHYDFHCTASLH